MRARQRVAEQKMQGEGGGGSMFSQYLSILTVAIGSMSLKDLCELTMYQMYDLVERYTLYLNWDLDVKSRLPLLSQKKYYVDLPYGYARGHEAYRYVENIRRYQLSLVGYLQAKESKNKILSKDKNKDENEEQTETVSSLVQETAASNP